MNATDLARQIQEWVTQRTNAAIRRYVPNMRTAGFFAGHRVNGDYMLDLGHVLSFLHQADVHEVGGRDLIEAMREILRHVDGKKTDTFYSYYASDMLLTFGKFEGNRLLDGMSPAEIANVAEAVDSSAMYNEGGKPLGGRPNNYWGVLARCEDARQRLGIPINTGILDEAVSRCEKVMFANPLGFFDDSGEMTGRFDIYSADTHLFLEPLWGRFDPEKLRHNLSAHVRQLETIAMESGASVAWGRSVGALSICLTIELAAVGLRHNLCGNPARVLALAKHAFEELKAWFSDDLVNAHRHRMTMNYRGPVRLLQMTFNCFSKLAYAAHTLLEAPGDDPALASPEAAVGAELFPARDEFLWMDENRSGVWMFRNKVLSFQLAVVDGGGADYAAAPRSPGLFETPVDSFMLCWTPRIATEPPGTVGDVLRRATIEYAATGLPSRIEKTAGGLKLSWDRWRRVNGTTGPETLPGRRDVEYRVEGDSLLVRETWGFAQAPLAATMAIPDLSSRPLRVEWTCSAPHETHSVCVDGMQFWRSFWNAFSRVHEIDVAPANRVEITYRVTPAVKVAQGPQAHDYNRGIYDAMPRDAIKEIGFESGNCAQSMMNVQKLFGDAEIVHIGWPEHLFSPHGLSDEDFDRRWGELIEALARSGKKVVWTMHNRRPHGWGKDRGVALYRRFAPIVDACLHHSRWGMDLMQREYSFKRGCLHVVVPHGHWGEKMQIADTREELERAFELPKCAIRIGVLGRYQKEKQIEMLIRAFLAAGRMDIQLALTAYRKDVPLPDGPGVYRLPRNDWMTREDITRHTKVCDILLGAHTGDTYLTSGLVGDAVGLGVAMLVPEWEFFREIMGDAAIYHDNTEEGVEEAIARLTVAEVERAREKTRGLEHAYDFRTLAPGILGMLRQLRLS